MRRQNGFTLLELLIAISIFAIVSAISYGTLAQISEQREHINKERDYWRSLSLLMLQIEEDLTYAINRPVRDNDGTSLPAFIGQPVDDRALGPPSLALVRTGQWVLANGSAPALSRIAYRLQDKNISRQKWGNLDRSPTATAKSTVMLRGVEDLKLRFLSGDGYWSSTWPALPSKAVLPAGVEIEITTTTRQTFRRLLVTNG